VIVCVGHQTTGLDGGGDSHRKDGNNKNFFRHFFGFVIKLAAKVAINQEKTEKMTKKNA
jgi:hypothetical protein